MQSSCCGNTLSGGVLNRNIAKFEIWHKKCPYGLGEEKVRIGTRDISFQILGWNLQ